MPIRTNRGRAAVYRRLWGWPMRSPTHLVGTIIMVAALLISAGMLVPRLLAEPGADGAGSAGPSSSSRDESSVDGGADGPDSADDVTTAPLPTRLSEPLATPESAPPDPEALRVAEEWVAAWLTRPEGGDTGQWLDGLRPYTTEEYLPRMRSVDPADISATRVIGTPSARESHPRSVEAEVTTDGPTLLLTVIETDAGWRVSDYREAVE
ncbi:hypothetical protein [Saccharomonospora saliphila]|uniref:hypothetical protein n=1 Tax=Saccharomonospora saliphila TaxID=369829 RepID=UPI0003740712|nr:hypothetical protein [Saccharomonospora saliphila]